MGHLATPKESKIALIQEVVDIYYKGNATALGREIDENKVNMSRALSGSSDKALDRIWRKVSAENYLQDNTSKGLVTTSGFGETINQVSVVSYLSNRLTPLVKDMIEKNPALKVGTNQVFTFVFPLEIEGELFDIRVETSISKVKNKPTQIVIKDGTPLKNHH
jgi:hypothetical protein